MYKIKSLLCSFIYNVREFHTSMGAAGSMKEYKVSRKVYCFDSVACIFSSHNYEHEVKFFLFLPGSNFYKSLLWSGSPGALISSSQSQLMFLWLIQKRSVMQVTHAMLFPFFLQGIWHYVELRSKVEMDFVEL